MLDRGIARRDLPGPGYSAPAKNSLRTFMRAGIAGLKGWVDQRHQFLDALLHRVEARARRIRRAPLNDRLDLGRGCRDIVAVR